MTTLTRKQIRKSSMAFAVMQVVPNQNNIPPIGERIRIVYAIHIVDKKTIVDGVVPTMSAEMYDYLQTIDSHVALNPRAVIRKSLLGDLVTGVVYGGMILGAAAGVSYVIARKTA